MLDHVTIGVSDFAKVAAFYDKPRSEPLGIVRFSGNGAHFAGYGEKPRAFFWIGIRDAVARPARISPSRPRTMPRSMRFIARRSPRAAATTARPASARNTARLITVPSSSIPTATTSKPCAIRPREGVLVLVLKKFCPSPAGLPAGLGRAMGSSNGLRWPGQARP